jgi:ABC-type sugar transport system ATPase subunit
MNLVNSIIADGTVRIPGTENRFTVREEWQASIREALKGDPEIVLGFRPEAANLNPDGELSGEVYASELQGAYAVLHVNVNTSEIVHIRTDRLINYPIGTVVHFDLNPNMVRFFNPKTEAAIEREVSA